MHDEPLNPLDDPDTDPFEVAAAAAADIARLTGVDSHDIALTLGSGWGKAADLIVVDGRPDEDLGALENVTTTFVGGRRMHG